MTPTATPLSWTDGALLLVLLTAGAFAVSWVATEVLGMVRRAYVGVLAVATAAATVGTARWTGATLHLLATDHWVAGVVVGVVTGAAAGLGLRRMAGAGGRALHGRGLLQVEAWDGVVYGIAEGVLLSALPAFVAWQVADARGWSAPVAWAATLAASAVLIAVHHLGYWDFRGRKVVPPVVACSILTVGYLATGSIIAPALGHVVLHLAGITKGVELPPHPHLHAVAH
jgi:hypothetical protein